MLVDMLVDMIADKMVDIVNSVAVVADIGMFVKGIVA